MSYWNGTHWVEPAAIKADPPGRRPGRATAALLIGALALVLPLASTVASSHRASAGDCVVSTSSAAVGETYWLGVSGLPTGIAINLWTTDATGTSGSPLGSTTDGTFHFQVSSAVGGTVTYTFSGPTKKTTTAYSSCSVSIR
jgi:hypothetical protein